MGRNTEEQIVSHAGSKVSAYNSKPYSLLSYSIPSHKVITNQAMKEGDKEKSLFASTHKPPASNGRPSSMVVKV